MKHELRGIKRSDIHLDFDLYRVNVPMPAVAGDQLSVIDIRPEGVEQTIVFVHGYAGCAETWEHQINAFAREYRVVAPDLRGHGQSDAPYTRYTMQELVADLFAISQYLQLPQRFTLVGHSFGGSICVAYANAHPEQLNHLVLIATAVKYPIPRLVSLAYRLPVALLRPVWKYRPRWNAELHVLKRMAVNNMLEWDGAALMNELTTPTLVITGERDTYFPRAVLEEVGRLIPNAETVDVGASKHKIQLERRQAVNRAIQRFIETDERHMTWREPTPNDDRAGARPWLKAYGATIPHTVPIPSRPLPEFLESAADWCPKRTATMFFGHKLSYAKLNMRVHQTAHALHGIGISPGERVMLLLPNAPELVMAYYGALRAGGVVVLPSMDATFDQVLTQTRATQPEVLVTLQGMEPWARVLQTEAGVREVLTVRPPQTAAAGVEARMLAALGRFDPPPEPEAPARTPARDLLELIQDAPFDDLPVQRSSHDLAVIAFTSGSTGAPRGACLTHGNLAANTLQARHWIQDLQYAKETVLSVLPLRHSFGMTAAMNLPIAVGATMLLLPSFELSDVLELIWSQRPTLFPGTPAIFAALSRAANVQAYGFASIKLCLSGGAPLPVEVHEAFERLTRGQLVEGYGLTEASPITHAGVPHSEGKDGSVGVPLPNTDARIVDFDSKAELPPDVIGELAIKGPQVMAGYWQGDGPGAPPPDGWLYTGDLAVMDSDGFFRIVGRREDVIWIGEQPVYPRDIEEVLYESSKVQEVAVLGMGAPRQQAIKAYVVLRRGHEPDSEELLSFCRRRLEPYAWPAEIEFVSRLPRSTTGKVLREELEGERGKF